ncbi:hypothetical protein BH09ACT9_BH09ACT9_00580 [soil metagenome]
MGLIFAGIGVASIILAAVAAIAFVLRDRD